MQDYGDPRGFPPVGEAAWPDGVLKTVALLLLILAVAACYAAYRAGRRVERDGLEDARARAPEIIFAAIRRQIDIALMATGERAFGPVRNLIESIDAYLGPVLKLTDGSNALAVTVAKLKKALATDRKKVTVEPERPAAGPGADGGRDGGRSGGSTVIITSGPAAMPVSAAPGVTASAGPGAVTASASVGGGGGVQVVHPAQVFEIPARDSPPPAAPPPAPKPVEKEVELTARERAQVLRDALEVLSDYWQKERVEGELRAAQRALTITAPIGDKTAAPARRPGGGPPPPGGAARPPRGGLPLFKL